MSAPSPRTTAPRRYTSTTLTAGVVVAGFCFGVALLAELLGPSTDDGEMTDIGAMLDGLLAVSPWAWAGLGTWVVVLTPVVGLVVTAWEYATISDRRTVGLALAVMAVLVTSAVVALLR